MIWSSLFTDGSPFLYLPLLVSLLSSLPYTSLPLSLPLVRFAFPQSIFYTSLPSISVLSYSFFPCSLIISTPPSAPFPLVFLPLLTLHTSSVLPSVLLLHNASHHHCLTFIPFQLLNLYPDFSLALSPSLPLPGSLALSLFLPHSRYFPPGRG